MRTIVNVLILMIVIGIASCSKPTPQKAQNNNDPFPVNYENELFSINIPKGWICDSSGWKGLDSIQNEVDIYDSNENLVWFHIVKAYFPIKWKNVDEAKEMSKMFNCNSENTELIHEIDSVEIGGYPTSILYFANYEDNDTIIQKQFVTYLQNSHIVMYFNEIFYVQNWDEAQEFGDKIINTIRLKRVENPLEKDSK